jgi:hypothetical protein
MEKSQILAGKISIGLQLGRASLETRNLSLGCLRSEPRWRPQIFPLGVWDFSVLPSYRCLILFLTNFPILYVFRCLILFLTKHPCFVYIPSSVFPQNCFPLVKLIVDLSMYISVLAVFKLYFIIKYNVFNKYIIYATTTAIIIWLWSKGGNFFLCVSY